ncbi:hypothetical protein ACFE04_030325 [Oxalis oulophora]
MEPNNNNNINNKIDEAEEEDNKSSSNKKKPRTMKTASQLQLLEQTYAAGAYPSESLRAELSLQLDLTDRQLQMWFCHRRLKDKKPPPAGVHKDSSPSPSLLVSTPVRYGHVGHVSRTGEPTTVVVVPRASTAHTSSTKQVVMMSGSNSSRRRKRRKENDTNTIPQQQDTTTMIATTSSEVRAIAYVEAQLGGKLREDGPILGLDFDPLPPGAFGAQIGMAVAGQHKQTGRSFEANAYETPVAKGPSRAVHEYQFLPEQPTVRTETYGRVTQTSGLNLMSREGRLGHHLPSSSRVSESPFVSPDMMGTNDEDVLRIEKRRKQSEETRIAREVEAHEKRIRRELERQDMLRRKREEQMRKEMERQERERIKEEERILREKQREEERCLREQRREMERQEKYLQKESIRAEKIRQKEESRRLKEVARLKAVNEKAIARKFAKESIDLVEDERLELLELAASSKGLTSILALDFETVQNLDVFRGKLSVFPPKSVQLKRPFDIQPWKSSDETVGNVLMVWRFLITFADVLGLWPFTLDEFVQAFHDYDSRLLGEIHVSLLKCVIKDIIDVARTSALGLGTNQSNAAGPPGGGHPNIIEGACAWGFDICSWQRHLSAQTWPEILRQFGLSAGFGPQLKKRNIEQTYPCDENEGNDGVEIVSNLRNGVAVGNAFAKMRGRGYSNLPRSRHRVTPGTVKYAIFHVLSLEGSKGLTILEVAEKIQKSGLRDLTTSKTPEASISAALSRDTKLFERTAPSTYCVRSRYRKDPSDAENILQKAKERVRIFKSKLVNLDDDGEDGDDVGKQEDSDSDIAEEPDVECLGTPKIESRDFQEEIDLNAKDVMGNGNDQVMETPQVRIGSVDEEFVSLLPDSENKLELIDISGICNETPDINQENLIDESNPGEPWLQGLMEGDYSVLSVEERLNALVALVGEAIEGNSIHLVLEERLEAANALKKQMWAEVQLDKRRMKEEFITRVFNPSSLGDRTELNRTNSTAEGRQTPFVNETLADPIAQPEHLSELQNGQIDTNNDFPSEKGPDSIQYQQQAQQAYLAEKSRSQLKSYIGHKAEELYVYRSLPVGQDRRYNRYWQFVTSPSCNDPGRGRIFVELHDGRWRLIDSEEAFNALLASLDLRGIRESHLHMMLQKIEKPLKETIRRNTSCTDAKRKIEDAKLETVKLEAGSDRNLHSPCSTVCDMDSDMCETSTSVAMDLGETESEKKSAFKRYRDFEKWMWKECSGSSTLCATKYGKKRAVQLLYICNSCHELFTFRDWQCPSCYRTCGSSETKFGFYDHVDQFGEKYKVGPDTGLSNSIACPLRISLLKVQLALIEVSIPPEALQTIWSEEYRISWGMKLLSAKSSEELLQMLTMLESALQKDFLSSKFETTEELLGLSGNDGYASSPDIVPVLPWVPKTSSALALRLMEFDKSISYTLDLKAEFEKNSRADDVSMVPTKYDVAKTTQDDQTADIESLGTKWIESGNVSARSARGRGSRGRPPGRTTVSRSQKKGRSGTGTRNSTVNSGNLRPRGRGGRKFGSRGTNKKQKPAKKVNNHNSNNNNIGERVFETPKNIIFKTPARSLPEEETPCFEILGSSEGSEYEDENGQTAGSYYDGQAADDYPSGFIDKSEDFVDLGDLRDEDGDDVVGVPQDDVDIEDYLNRDTDEEGMDDGDPDEVMESMSSDSEFSD